MGDVSTEPRLHAPAGATDTHMHFYGPYDRFPLAPTSPSGPPPALVADYRKLQARLGLERVVVVQPVGYATDNRRTMAAVAEIGDAARAVVVVDAEAPETELQALADGGAAGLRVFMLKGGSTGSPRSRSSRRRSGRSAGTCSSSSMAGCCPSTRRCSGPFASGWSSITPASSWSPCRSNIPPSAACSGWSMPAPTSSSRPLTRRPGSGRPCSTTWGHWPKRWSAKRRSGCSGPATGPIRARTPGPDEAMLLDFFLDWAPDEASLTADPGRQSGAALRVRHERAPRLVRAKKRSFALQASPHRRSIQALAVAAGRSIRHGQGSSRSSSWALARPEIMHSSTPVGQAKGSTPFSLAVVMRLATTAQRRAPQAACCAAAEPPFAHRAGGREPRPRSGRARQSGTGPLPPAASRWPDGSRKSASFGPRILGLISRPAWWPSGDAHDEGAGQAGRHHGGQGDVVRHGDRAVPGARVLQQG